MARKIAIVQPLAMPKPPAEQEEAGTHDPPLRFPSPAPAPVSGGQPNVPAPESGRKELLAVAPVTGLWELDIIEVTGHNLEARGREEVNRLLAEGWRLLHIYTLRYREDDVWRERPMAILGKPQTRSKSEGTGEAGVLRGGLDENPAGSG